MNCECCFHDFIVKCNTSLHVYAQLAPLSDYTWIITDKFGNKYQGEFTTDANGFWQIPVDQLPSGLLTQYSGEFALQVQDTGCKPVKFKIAQEYDCINFTVKGGTYEKDTIGCDFGCLPEVGSQAQILPFTGENEVNITWTTELLTAYGNNPTIRVYKLVSETTYELVDATINKVFTGEVLAIVLVSFEESETGYILIS